ncbi:MAG: UDP-GlcNAc:undecaprenyl-phosphate GlcNAc-1-phosphate transferase [Glaciecola sp.]|jgi:UDP-GlcNAc:undecaprenyl-phosphate GlcNAc-1-phosphate transferase
MNIYVNIALATVLAFLVSYFVIPQVIKWANRKGVLAQHNHRASHVIPTPSMGGVGIFLGLMTVLPFLEYNIELIMIFITVTVMFVMGFWDDLHNMKSMVKLGIQLGCAVLLYFSGFTIDNLHGIFGIYELSVIVSFLITVLFIAGVTNAFNLIDGIDGLAGGISIINFLFFGLIFLMNNQFTYAIISIALSGALLGFLKYNFSPAKIFMGDAGSLFLGLLMSVFVIKTFQTNTSTELSVSLSIVLIFLPVFDTIRLFVQRILKKKSPFSADKNHLHHLVLKIVPNHTYATVIICLLHSGLLSVIFFENYFNKEIVLTFLVIASTLLVALFLIVIVSINLRQRILKLKESTQSIINKNKLLENI